MADVFHLLFVNFASDTDQNEIEARQSAGEISLAILRLYAMTSSASCNTPSVTNTTHPRRAPLGTCDLR